MPYPHGSIIEASYMVRDIHKALDKWINVLGAGPFYLGEVHIPAERHKRRGEAGPLSMKVAFGLSADLLIELVEPLPDDRSIYSEALAAIGDTSHSQAINYVLNLDWDEGCALMEERNYEPVLQATTNIGGLRCTIYDARADVGAFVEIGEGIRQVSLPMIEAMQQARKVWDGCSIFALEDVFKVVE